MRTYREEAINKSVAFGPREHKPCDNFGRTLFTLVTLTGIHNRHGVDLLIMSLGI